MLIVLRSVWPLRYEIANDNWWEVATPVTRTPILSAQKPRMSCQTMHQSHVYMGDYQNHFNNNQTQDNTTIRTL